MTMSFVSSLLTAVFMMFIVFLVLVLLWTILRILGVIFLSREKMKVAQENSVQPAQRV